MHLSNHAFISAFLRQYFFVDTNSRQCFKNIHAKKEKKKTTLLLSTLHRFARDTQEGTFLSFLCLLI